ncbi:MAG: EAL domain-containing protein [Thermoanaerobaculia bacterium]
MSASLPATPSPARAAATGPSREAERPRILVVDDVPETLLLFSSCLASAGMDSVTAESGERALELLGSDRFDAVLTDVQMPGMNGVELLLATRERDVDLPVVLITGCPEEDLPDGAMELAPGGLLLKPVDPDQLVRAVTRAVRFCRLARVARRQERPPGPRPGLPGGPAAAPAFARALSELYLAWQPVVRAADGSVHGHEAFVRTLEPSLGDPAAFLSVARELGRTADLGRAVRRAAASESLAFPGELLFVNVSLSELDDEELYASAAPLTGFSRSVVLEVSEEAARQGGRTLVERVRNLHRLGFRIAVDDFGSGGGDVASVARLEPDVVKLDLPLVRGLESEPGRQTRVREVIRAFHDQGIEVVAEAIETPGERHAAIELGADFLQGFLFGRPKPVA